ncbi:MAG TPA: alpha/beta hydrolase-fold protein [Actinophytocola sp.]|uniref:alpha/beta hydrolase n=1 Tax=Actinophytocola sp. TaxID=1872138 RepID=UPI002DDCDD1E|nr:alpha/beta hydrolase-fold protein [Actinophytocola sp.]HEV2778990.1 alpha/beta hydrolase-fold protein [Actinophytocola sp.]
MTISAGSTKSRNGRVSRRGFLLGGLGVGIAGVDACGAPATNASGNSPDRVLSGEVLTSPPAAPAETVSAEQVHSPARGGSVELITIRPAGVGGLLPVCVALHGRSSGARMFLDLGVPELLDQVVAAGVRPFAVAAVDGGDTYWVAKDPKDDPQRMLLEDLPQWLANRGFASAPSAALGISMGGYGALNYARNPGLTAVAAVSAALFTNWPDARLRNAFAGEAQWQATDPLRHVQEIAQVPLGVWCGTGDPFIAANRQLIDKAKPKVAALAAGDHDAAYWRRILPDVLRFIGASMP